jgi:hypothetical protein
MSFTEASKAGWALLKRNSGSILGAGAVSYTIVFGVLFGTGQLIVATAAQPIEPTTYWRSLSIPYKLCWLLGFVLSAWTPQLMTHAGAAWVALQETKGESVSTAGTVRAIVARLPRLILLALLIGVPAFIGGLLLVIPGLIASAIGVMIVPETVIGHQKFGAGVSLGIRVGRKYSATTGLTLVLAGLGGLLLFFVLGFISVALPSGAGSVLLSIGVLLLVGILTSAWVGAVVSAICIEHHRPSVVHATTNGHVS